MSKIFSTEDGNLNTISLLTSREKIYSDIDLSFLSNPDTGDIYKRKDASAVKQAVKNLLQTSRFEKPFRPEFGADIRNLLFELSDGSTSDEIEEQIRGSLERYEPRIEITRLKVDSRNDYNTLHVKLEFNIINSEQNVSLETTVSRLR